MISRIQAKATIEKYLSGKTYSDYITGYFVLCKLCGAAIKQMTGKQMTLQNYCELTLVFSDGSKHETCLCTKCFDRLEIETLKLIYFLDIKQWLKEENELNWEMLLNKSPVSYSLGART